MHALLLVTAAPVVQLSLDLVHLEPHDRHVLVGQRERLRAADAHLLRVTDHQLPQRRRKLGARLGLKDARSAGLLGGDLVREGLRERRAAEQRDHAKLEVAGSRRDGRAGEHPHKRRAVAHHHLARDGRLRCEV